MDRTNAVDRLETILDDIESDPLPVPVREVWVFGELPLGLDPISRLDVYLRKDMLFASEMSDPSREAEFEEAYGIAGIGTTINPDWAEAYPDRIETSANGYAAPERCLATHLSNSNEPIHFEICNASFEQNVTQRLKGAKIRNAWEEVLDPRAVCLWKDSERSRTATDRLQTGEYVFPPLAAALEMLGLDEADAETAADAIAAFRESTNGVSIRSDVLSETRS